LVSQVRELCDHESVPRGTAARWKRRYTVRLTVPRRGGWRAWGVVGADFEHALAAPADPASTSAEIASELRRGADYVRVTIAITVLSTDVADALAIAWDAFRSAARDDLARLGGNRGQRGGHAGAAVNPGQLARSAVCPRLPSAGSGHPGRRY
jgi:hypothetical protein